MKKEKEYSRKKLAFNECVQDAFLQLAFSSDRSHSPKSSEWKSVDDDVS